MKNKAVKIIIVILLIMLVFSFFALHGKIESLHEKKAEEATAPVTVANNIIAPEETTSAIN